MYGQDYPIKDIFKNSFQRNPMPVARTMGAVTEVEEPDFAEEIGVSPNRRSN